MTFSVLAFDEAVVDCTPALSLMRGNYNAAWAIPIPAPESGRIAAMATVHHVFHIGFFAFWVQRQRGVRSIQT
jgi:hypothetical protein